MEILPMRMDRLYAQHDAEYSEKALSILRVVHSILVL